MSKKAMDKTKRNAKFLARKSIHNTNANKLVYKNSMWRVFIYLYLVLKSDTAYQQQQQHYSSLYVAVCYMYL